LEKERCVAEAEKFIAEFYRHKFIKPAPKNYQFNHIVDFRADFSGSYLRFYAKYACLGPRALSPSFEHPFARLGCFARDRWNLWARRHNDRWICIERQLQTLPECFKSLKRLHQITFAIATPLTADAAILMRHSFSHRRSPSLRRQKSGYLEPGQMCNLHFSA
jgi:hypothetical protein